MAGAVGVVRSQAGAWERGMRWARCGLGGRMAGAIEVVRSQAGAWERGMCGGRDVVWEGGWREPSR